MYQKELQHPSGFDISACACNVEGTTAIVKTALYPRERASTVGFFYVLDLSPPNTTHWTGQRDKVVPRHAV
jgi:hypothetical protein